MSTEFFLSVQATSDAVTAHAAELVVIAGGSLAAYAIAARYIPRAAETLFQRNLYGIDLNKTTAEERQAFAKQRERGDTASPSFRRQAVPESLGIVVGSVYLSAVMVLACVLAVTGLLTPAQVNSTLAGPLTTITVMLLLGFVDDVLDVRWRHKLILSALGSLPLALTYDGSLSVLVPHLPMVEPWLREAARNEPPPPSSAPSSRWASFFPATASMNSHKLLTYVPETGSVLLFLGPLYILYICMLCIFCTNSINILAGVNGVEVGQSMVIAVASSVYNIFQLRLEGLDPAVRAAAPELSSDHQIRALLLLGPFLGVSMALWKLNKYPSSVFVGDSYTYFAGTVLAVAGITGIYTKTLLLFFTPQVINFLISVPQLFHIVPCPRHRVPTWSKERNTLSNSHNYTVLNVLLYLFGEMHEAVLTRRVMEMQAYMCLMGFVVRYVLASMFYDQVQ